MKASAESRTIRRWDVAVAAAILAVLLAGWLTAGGAAAGPPRVPPSVAHVCRSLSAAPGGQVQCAQP
jgi:hypothetical protein